MGVVHVVTVLTIGGSDPTGGAGIQADLQTIASLGAHGAAVIAALTVQDTSEVHATRSVPADWVRRQLTRLLADVPLAAIKTGMLATAPVVRAVAEILWESGNVPLVVDPVLRSTSGHELLDNDGIAALREKLFPRATLVTPNLQEAELLSGHGARTIEQMKECARLIADTGPESVLVKGGHLVDQPVDVLFADGQAVEMPGERIAPGRQVHGTGCAFSAAAATFIAHGDGVPEAVTRAKAYVAAGLREAVAIGRGGLIINCRHAASEVLG